jgi:homocysteine S-methyltransferase
MAIGTLAAALDANAGCLILDGGLGSDLERRGHDLRHPLWSALMLTENPAALAEVNRDFAEAGADILATATYQATFPGLEKLGLDREESLAVFRKGVHLTRDVAGAFDPPKLAGLSIGSHGAYLADGSEYSGTYDLSDSELADFHRDRLAVLAPLAAERDLLAFETLPNGREARVLAELLTEFPETEAWFSFCCRNERELRDGTPIEECARFLNDYPQVAAIGANCVEPRHAPELIRRIASETGKPVMIYPNSGMGFDSETRTWTGAEETAETFADQAVEWRQAGASIIGGCCRTTPEHIRLVRERLRSGTF